MSLRPMPWPLLASLLAAVLAGCSGGGLPEPDPGRPDLVLISVDTLRPDHLGCYGYGRPTSPFLDELAAGGTRFADAWAPSPWTLPSHATMLTGALTPRHGAVEEELSLAPGLPLLADRLREAGYATCGVVTSVFVDRRYGFDRGFDRFIDFGLESGEREALDVPDAEEVTAAALAWAREQADGRPVFLFLHLYDVHYPYDPPPPWNERFNRPARPEELRYENYQFYLRRPPSAAFLAQQRGQYDEEIAYTDDCLRRLHETWTAARPGAVFAVVSDHGEEFGERGSWGHAHTLTPEVLRVPWIVAGPGIAGQVAEGRVGLEDVAPTLAALAGVPFAAPDGRDLSGRLRGDAAAGPGAGTGAAPGDSLSPVPGPAAFAATSRHATLKHRWHEGRFDLIADLRAGGLRLYDLRTDPAAGQDLAAALPDTARRLAANMYRWLGQPWEALAAGEIETDGVLVVDGEPVPVPRLTVAPGRRFALFPADARIGFLAPDGGRAGPWQADGGRLPEPGAPLAWHGQRPATGRIPLTAAQRERLRSLGYVQ